MALGRCRTDPILGFSRTGASQNPLYVLQGGHDVARRDVIRRFKRGWENFESNFPMVSRVGFSNGNWCSAPVIATCSCRPTSVMAEVGRDNTQLFLG